MSLVHSCLLVMVKDLIPSQPVGNNGIIGTAAGTYIIMGKLITRVLLIVLVLYKTVLWLLPLVQKH